MNDDASFLDPIILGKLYGIGYMLLFTPLVIDFLISPMLPVLLEKGVYVMFAAVGMGIIWNTPFQQFRTPLIAIGVVLVFLPFTQIIEQNYLPMNIGIAFILFGFNLLFPSSIRTKILSSLPLLVLIVLTPFMNKMLVDKFYNPFSEPLWLILVFISYPILCLSWGYLSNMLGDKDVQCLPISS